MAGHLVIEELARLQPGREVIVSSFNHLLLAEFKRRALREAGYEVNVWTVNNPARANQLKNWGATGVFTDYPERMLQLED